MPIKKELQHFYRGKEWEATRARILKRAKNCCERCQVPNSIAVARINKYRGWWFTMEGEAHDETGVLQFHFKGSEFEDPDRIVTIRLTIAHLNQTPGDDRDENLAALWCHLNYDRPVNKVQSKETRLDRKDADRLLLQEAL